MDSLSRVHSASCPASFPLLPDSLCAPPSSLPIPISWGSPYAALFMLRTDPEVAVLTLSAHAAYFYPRCSSLPGWQAPTAQLCRSSSKMPSSTDTASQVSPNVSSGLCGQMPLSSGFPAVSRENFVPRVGLREKGERRKEERQRWREGRERGIGRKEGRDLVTTHRAQALCYVASIHSFIY